MSSWNRPPRCFAEERLRRGEHGHVVHGPREAVALVGRDEVLDREAALAQRDDDLVGLGLLHARIVGALHHEQRRRDLVGGVERRLALELRLALGRVRIAHARVEDLAAGSQYGGIESSSVIRFDGATMATPAA
jgi:hypothetical protein